MRDEGIGIQTNAVIAAECARGIDKIVVDAVILSDSLSSPIELSLDVLLVSSLVSASPLSSPPVMMRYVVEPSGRTATHVTLRHLIVFWWTRV